MKQGKIYLNKVSYEDGTYHPRVTSSITAQEIWNTGSPYNPNGTIYQDGSNVGISTSTPSTTLDVSGTMAVSGAATFSSGAESTAPLTPTSRSCVDAASQGSKRRA